VSSAALAERLCEELSRSGVDWCHVREPDPARLEFAVQRSAAAGLARVALGLGFKTLCAPGSPDANFLGHDRDSGALLRVHVDFSGGSKRLLPGALPGSRRQGRRRSQLEAGGAVIAVVGADGAGKTSALDALRAWLGCELWVETLHLGKPPWSPGTWLIKGLLKALRSVTGLRPGDGRAGSEEAWLLWRAVTARDRARAVRRARRQAERGALVLCDRYPLHALHSMDGMRSASTTPASRLRGWLLDREARYYAAIEPPDLLAVLQVPVAVARARKPQDPGARVQSRAREVLNVDWSEAGAHVVDAAQPLGAVHDQLKTWLWGAL
jgi:thymidylate kinase